MKKLQMLRVVSRFEDRIYTLARRVYPGGLRRAKQLGLHQRHTYTNTKRMIRTNPRCIDLPKPGLVEITRGGRVRPILSANIINHRLIRKRRKQL